MSREIRVNPQELRASAQRLSALVEALSLQRDQILESAAAAPSYDGQFGSQVNALAADAAAQVHSTFTRLGELARQLEAIAELFETADAETLKAIEGIWIQIKAQIAGFMTLLARLSPPGAPPPQVRLDLTLEEFQAMSAEQRIAWVEAFNEGAGEGWFSNFEDILHFFNDSKVFTGLDGSTPASLWMSWGDAGVLQVVQDGYLLAHNPNLKLSDLPESFPENTARQRTEAAQLWADFFEYQRERRDDLSGVRRLWGAAEQAGVDYGEALAELTLERYSIEMSGDESRFVDVFVRFGDAYRMTIANGAGQAVFEAAPSVLGGQFGEGMVRAWQVSTRSEFDQLARLVGLFAGDRAAEDIRSAGEALLGKDTILGSTNEFAESIGQWAGQQFGDRLEPQLGAAGEAYFDPQFRLSSSVESSTQLGEVEIEATLRGPLYHLSMTVEHMLLSGNAELVESFLDGVEESVDRAIGQEPD